MSSLLGAFAKTLHALSDEDYFPAYRIGCEVRGDGLRILIRTDNRVVRSWSEDELSMQVDARDWAGIIGDVRQAIALDKLAAKGGVALAGKWRKWGRNRS